MIDDEPTKKLFGAAIYAALTEGERNEVKGGKVYRFKKVPWLISVSLLKGQATPHDGPQQEVRVAYKRRTVFHVVGPPADPTVQMQILRCRYWSTVYGKPN
jgi:hypothetical protein